MYFNAPFKKLDICEITALKSLAITIPENQWLEYDQKSKNLDIHNQRQRVQGQIIPLIFNEDYRHRLPSTWPALLQFQHQLAPIVRSIVKYYKKQTFKTKTSHPDPVSKGYFIRIILTKLTPHSKLPPLIDNGFSSSRAHRIHLPVITNKQVKFMVDGITKTLEEGELWEINNRLYHSIENLSTQSAIYFTFDFVVPEEIIADPIGIELYA